MEPYYYHNTISQFLKSSTEEIIGKILSDDTGFTLQFTQRDAWIAQIQILKEALTSYNGHIFFEFSIPRMGRRVDAALIINGILFVLEFKVGESEFLTSARDQVWDYALDLKNFHETSHQLVIAPILVATEANMTAATLMFDKHDDQVLVPINTNKKRLGEVIKSILDSYSFNDIDGYHWAAGRYSPTPTIIEAAMALYNKHSVQDISRNDAAAINLSRTSLAIENIIQRAEKNKEKSICFVTGVPGAGKTLVGLNVATKQMDKENGKSSVFLSGNGPLVAVLREALAIDMIKRKKALGEATTKGKARREVKVFIQNVHHFRDAYLSDNKPPYDHVAIFDEAQRAWNHQQTAGFMKQKRKVASFAFSEPEFLISCLDRHDDWAVVVCLVGGGQEIHKGEAGISEWIYSLNRSFPKWKVYISPKLTDAEYAAGDALSLIRKHKDVSYLEDLHLSVSLRSFRAEHLSSLVKALLDLEAEEAFQYYQKIKTKYPIVLTRNLQKAKSWLKMKARGTERCGMVVSSQAYRLKPLAVDVRAKVDPVHYFLHDKADVRSSYYLEDAATEFQIQGLELDWVGLVWDGDFRYSKEGWKPYSFKGSKWQHIRKEERKFYLKNAYRVLLTRARQGMVIVVPEGAEDDATRQPDFYNGTYDYLKNIGFELI